jgi:leader peptidase (prepilin peptidase)/N-methyltransferase
LVVISFFVGAMAALVIALLGMAFGKGGEDAAIPFGPGLATGVIVTWLCWPSIGPALQEFFFSEIWVGFITVFVGGGLLGLTFLLRFLSPPDEAPPEKG